MKAVIKVRLKNGILDPQGKTVENALNHLGFDSFNGVRIGKLIEANLKETNKARASKQVEEACKKLLSNPVIEDFSYELNEE
jgi:phosphoribosylformylglycinamidine synthase PurS subunit